MGERYWITGVQLGLLTVAKEERYRKRLMNKIIDKQFLEKDEYYIITRKQLLEFMFEYGQDCVIGTNKIPSNWLNNTIQKLKIKPIKEKYIKGKLKEGDKK